MCKEAAIPAVASEDFRIKFRRFIFLGLDLKDKLSYKIKLLQINYLISNICSLMNH